LKNYLINLKIDIMKIKLLFAGLIIGLGLSAQDTIRSLIITELRIDHQASIYYELTNMGDTPIDLSEFEVGVIDPFTQPYNPPVHQRMMLPKKILDPGKSFVLATIFDFTPKQTIIEKQKYGYNLEFHGPQHKVEMETLADLQIHVPEKKGDETDSVSVYRGVGTIYNGRTCFYLRHHVSETDSVVVDQFNGIFNEADGTGADAPRDVAGVTDATFDHIFVRRFSVKTGNTDFEKSRGIDLNDTEWFPIPRLENNMEPHRAVFWTVGNHGDYNLDANTLVSQTIKIDWDKHVLTVPWGTKNQDSIMYEFERKPGLAWHYHENANRADSAYTTCRNDDTLTVYACGNDLEIIKFAIKVEEPSKGENRVFPKLVPNEGIYDNGYVICEVGRNNPVMDTIWSVPYATRKDTLLKYLEKAPAANWEIIQVDAPQRADLKRGDKLKVTAENGAVKEYFIKVDIYHTGRNPYLNAITWPDIPEDYRNLYGWIEDTIPGFVRTKFDYKVWVPYDFEGIPSLIATPQDINASVEVKRAESLIGDQEARTVTFISKAEMDTIQLEYRVVLQKQSDYSNIQPFKAEPFISEYFFWDQWQNGFLEICNPGTVPLNLGEYMIVGGWFNDPAEAITSIANETDYANRYQKYIPGHKWQDQTNWQIQPAIAVEDLNINPVVQPGDVFVLGDIRTTSVSGGYDYTAAQNTDIDFNKNPWNETVGETACRQWAGANFFLFKILNDSVNKGLKPATDPFDYELIDVFGSGDGLAYVVGGVERSAEQLMITSWVRKPQYTIGKPGFKESFGTTPENSEWVSFSMEKNDKKNVPWPDNVMRVGDDIGSHFFEEMTSFKSTVKSRIYTVTNGYSQSEGITDIKTGTLVGGFYSNIMKADENQKLKIRSSAGNLLSDTDPLTTGDTLIVVSADSANTSKYLTQPNRRRAKQRCHADLIQVYDRHQWR
jgi:hypothetical protein